jgi:hypothetical protein
MLKKQFTIGDSKGLILLILLVKKLIVLMNDDFEVMHYYVQYNELYYAHDATGHVGRNLIMLITYVNSLYNNFNIEAIHFYIDKNYHRIGKNI